MYNNNSQISNVYDVIFVSLSLRKVLQTKHTMLTTVNNNTNITINQHLFVIPIDSDKRVIAVIILGL